MPDWAPCGYITPTEDSPNHMRKHIRLLRYLCLFVLGVCITAVSCALIGLIASIARPAVELELLYRAWKAMRLIAFGLIAFYVITAFVISFLSGGKSGTRELSSLPNRDRRVLQIFGVICVALVLFNWNALYVLPSGGKWLAVSKVGSWEISLALARLYIWRNISWSIAIVLAPGFGMILFAKNLARAASSILQQLGSAGRPS